MIRTARTSLPSALPVALSLTALAWTTGAAAQEETMEEPPAEGTEETDFSDMGEDDGVDLQEEPMETETTPPEEEGAFEASGKREPDGSTQLLIGARYRALITPKFLINMFGVDGGRTVLLHGVGPEIGGYFGETADGFMILFSPWYVNYGLEATPFKGKKDGPEAWEIIESDMSVWYLSFDAMWDHKIIDRLSVDVGLGAGLGIVTGKLRRNEAYVTPDGGDPDLAADKDWPDLGYCGGPNDPNGTECPGDGNYDLTQGGSSDRWPVYPWLNFQTGLRYQPVDEFVGRLDIGVGSSGFWIGIGADYSLFL